MQINKPDRPCITVLSNRIYVIDYQKDEAVFFAKQSSQLSPPCVLHYLKYTILMVLKILFKCAFDKIRTAFCINLATLLCNCHFTGMIEMI